MPRDRDRGHHETGRADGRLRRETRENQGEHEDIPSRSSVQYLFSRINLLQGVQKRMVRNRTQDQGQAQCTLISTDVEIS